MWIRQLEIAVAARPSVGSAQSTSELGIEIALLQPTYYQPSGSNITK